MNWLIKKHEASSTPFGTYPGARSLSEHIKNGIIIIDKTSGPTSHQIDRWIKELLNVSKVSHGGTLDPRASGVLLIALENSTKLMPIILSSRKEYVGLVHLHKDVDETKVRELFSTTRGRVKQLPPVKSAVARRIREREIYYLELLEIDGRNVLFKIGTEAGFYVRRFADDVGKKLGVGGHLQELRRTRSGSFGEESAITMQQLFDTLGDEGKMREVIMPMELVIGSIGKVVISDSAIENICSGAPLGIGGIARLEDGIFKGGWVAMLSMKGELVAIGRALLSSQEIVKMNRGLAVKTDKVLMRKGTYPLF